MNKCEVCKVYVSCFNQEKCCAFEHNGDKDICPFEDEYLDLSVHDEKVRADEKAKYIELLEMCAEEIENLYGKETELTQKIRTLVEQE